MILMDAVSSVALCLSRAPPLRAEEAWVGLYLTLGPDLWYFCLCTFDPASSLMSSSVSPLEIPASGVDLTLSRGKIDAKILPSSDRKYLGFP